MIGRVLWIVAMLGIAAVTSYAQLDRQARVTPGLAANVPESFRAFAQPHIAAEALEGEDADRALTEAQRLVARRPVAAEHLQLLALAQYKAGQPQAATISIQLAAQRGWRNVQVQESMLRLALAAGEQGEAARRFTALMLNQASNEATLRDLAPAVFKDASAQDALVDVLAGGARWHNRFLERGSQILPPNAFANIIGRSAERGVQFDCSRLKSAQTIVRKRHGEASAMLSAFTTERC